MTAYLRPFPANDAGVASATSTDSVEVIQNWDAWELRPIGETNNAGVVFLPGMLVVPRAYFPLLIPLVEQGTVVVIPTAPLGMSINGDQATKKAMNSKPDIDTWIVGGHSMGGASASSVAKKNSNMMVY